MMCHQNGRGRHSREFNERFQHYKLFEMNTVKNAKGTSAQEYRSKVKYMNSYIPHESMYRKSRNGGNAVFGMKEVVWDHNLLSWARSGGNVYGLAYKGGKNKGNRTNHVLVEPHLLHPSIGHFQFIGFILTRE